MDESSAHFIDALDRRVERRNERREFFRTALGAAAIAGAGVAAVSLSGPAAAQSVTEADVLNFALNLEYLEAQFYSFAAFGNGLPAALTASGSGTAGGTVSGGKQVQFTDTVVRAYAREIANDEIAHVTFLRNALGTAAVAQPAIDIGSTATSAFSRAAQAAGVVAAGAAFDPYASDEAFLLGAFIFEDVGVTAYKGAAPLLSSLYLDAAAGILAAEAYHAGLIRTVLFSKGVNTGLLRTAAGQISDARDSLDGTSDDDQGIIDLADATRSNIVPADGNGLVYSRAATSVLNIVYLNKASTAGGGFFPNGLNGNIRTSTAQP